MKNRIDDYWNEYWQRALGKRLYKTPPIGKNSQEKSRQRRTNDPNLFRTLNKDRLRIIDKIMEEARNGSD